MKAIRFEKAGKEIEITIEKGQYGTRAMATCEGVKIDVIPRKVKGQWVYQVSSADTSFIELLTTQKVVGNIFLSHPTAEEVEKEVKRQRKEEANQTREKWLRERDKKEKAFFDIARATGEKVMIDSYPVLCDDPNEESDIEIISIYAMPDGERKTVRSRAW